MALVAASAERVNTCLLRPCSANPYLTKVSTELQPPWRCRLHSLDQPTDASLVRAIKLLGDSNVVGILVCIVHKLGAFIDHITEKPTAGELTEPDRSKGFSCCLNLNRRRLPRVSLVDACVTAWGLLVSQERTRIIEAGCEIPEKRELLYAAQSKLSGGMNWAQRHRMGAEDSIRP